MEAAIPEAANLKNLRRGLNSLNSDTGLNSVYTSILLLSWQKIFKCLIQFWKHGEKENLYNLAEEQEIMINQEVALSTS